MTTMEMIRHLNEQAGVFGEMSLTADFGADIIETLGSGFWSVKQAQAFCDDWAGLVRRIHASGRAVAAISNMVDCQVQTAEVTAILAATTYGLYDEGDAIAMLVPSSLAKMQLRRTLDNRFHGFFVSPDAARLWLSSRGFPGAERHRPSTAVA